MALSTRTLADQLRAKRSELMVSELEATALRLFETRGFGDVTVEDIAAEAQISVRTFYRYFPTKEAVFQLRIDRRAAALEEHLAARPDHESPWQSLRLALEQGVAEEDPDLLRRWVTVIATTPAVVKGVLGGIQLKSQRVMARFFGSRLGRPTDDLVPTMLAAAAGGVIQAAHIHWYLNGGDLATHLSEAMEVLEHGLRPPGLD